MPRSRILICGHNHYGYLNFISRGFAANDCDVKILAHKDINCRKLEHSLPLKRWRTRRKIMAINNATLRALKQFEPTLVLSINGGLLIDSTIEQINQSAISILWLWDSITEVSIKLRTMQRFHILFVCEPTDMDLLSKTEKYYLPLGYEDQFYQPLSIEKSYDLAFIGSAHENRLPILDDLAVFCSKQDIHFSVHGPFSCITRKRVYRKRYPNLINAIAHNTSLCPSNINVLYNQSWINLNLHHDQFKDGMNPRTFEIAGAGAFQLVNNKTKIAELFQLDEEMVAFNSVDELKEKIIYYLRHKPLLEQIAKKAWRKVYREHTFTLRTREILNNVHRR